MDMVMKEHMTKWEWQMKHALSMINKWLNLKAVEEKYPESVFVGEFPIKKHSEYSGCVFWQPNPPHGYSNYFMIYMCPVRNTIYITSGKPQSDQVYTGLLTPNGSFIYSRHRHDYIEHDGCMVDGGDSYVRHNMVGELISFRMEGPKLVRIPMEGVSHG